MKRNWDTIREILLDTENLEPNQTLSLSNYSEDRAFEISYHVKLLTEAGILDGSISETLGPSVKNFFVRSITWQGHEFLDSIREKSTWQKTKDTISSKGGVMTFDVIKSVASGIVKSGLGL